MKNKQVFTLSCHAEFISASSRDQNNKTLKQVQGDGRRGFTLIELLVVVLIIGILAAVALPQYQKAVLKTRVSELQLAISNLENAVDVYALETGFSGSEEDTNLIPSLTLDYTGSYSYNEDSNSYCDAKKVCITAGYSSGDEHFLVCAASRQKSGFQSAPDYYLCSSRSPASNAWTRTYYSCDTNIDNLGLNVFGYQRSGC